MKDRIFSFILSHMIDLFLNSMTQDQVKREIDALIDRLENLIKESDNTLDDSFLGLLIFARDVLNVPDYPEGAAIPPVTAFDKP